jgi:Kef-type K+ transport system membrane component KefB
VAFLQTVLSLAVVGATMTAVMAYVLGEPWRAVVVPGVVLGCVAAASTLTGIRLVAHRRLDRRVLVRQIEVASGMDAAVAIAVFGLVLCLYHAAPPADVRPPTPTEWAVVAILIGCLGGALFHLFLNREQDRDRLYLSLVGALTLASGAAAFTRLSPLLPTMLIGAILVNTTGNRHEIRAVLSAVQRPVHFLLLVFAGAAWRPTEAYWILPIVVFIAVRFLAKVGSARIAARASGMLPGLGPHWGRALLGQGSLATAIALNYRIYDTSALPNVVFTAALVSVLLTDLLSARFVRAVLLRQQRESGTVETPATRERTAAVGDGSGPTAPTEPAEPAERG